MEQLPEAAATEHAVIGDAASHLAALPKVELHLHLDCSLSYDAVHRLDPSISLARYHAEFIAPDKCLSLADFLRYPPRQIALLQTREALRVGVLDVFEQLRRDGVVYAELRFAPHLHTERGLTLDDVVAAVDMATEEGIARTGVEASLILCTLRHFTPEQGLAMAEVAARFKATPGSHVAAIDLAGDEAGYPVEPHAPVFAYAAAHGLARTAHAGEASGPASVRATLTALGPSRIGHGARSIEDAALVEALRRTGIHLEVCPSSNLQTNLCATYADHPIERLRQSGVSLGVSTDCRTVTDVTLGQEYARLRATFGWTARELLACNLAAIEAAFAPAEVKARVAERLRAGYAPSAGTDGLG